MSVDSLFVDEVQDFTQAETFVMAKLCRDPNNLFLAGDTAQSIAVGVDFRFTDVRQILADRSRNCYSFHKTIVLIKVFCVLRHVSWRYYITSLALLLTSCP